MKKEKQYKFGAQAERVVVILEYQVEKNRNGQRIMVDVCKQADLDFDPEHDGYNESLGMFKKIADFQKAGNALMRQAKKLLGTGQFIKITILSSIYEHVEEYTDYSGGFPCPCTLRPLVSNCWEYKGNGTEGELDPDEGGLYFRPDERYTRPEWDMFIPWGSDILKMLAEVNV